MENHKQFCGASGIFFELAARVLCDVAPKKADAAYLFAHTPDNEDAILEAGAALWKSGQVKYLAVYGKRHENLYLGPEHWKKKLIQAGVAKSAVLPVPLQPDFPPSTDGEAIGFTRFAKEKNWKSAYVISTPLHQLRAFVSAVSALKSEQKKSNFKLNLYGKTTLPLDWNEYNLHSQSQKGIKARRRDLFASELKKINTYYAKGDLASAENVIGYLNLRDGN